MRTRKLVKKAEALKTIIIQIGTNISAKNKLGRPPKKAVTVKHNRITNILYTK